MQFFVALYHFRFDDNFNKQKVFDIKFKNHKSHLNKKHFKGINSIMINYNKHLR